MSNHNHGSCQHESRGADHTPEMGLQYSLYKKIDLLNLQCLNESQTDAGKRVFKAWENRLEVESFVESAEGPRLLFNIPFTGNVKLKGIIVMGGEGDTHPSKIQLFKNKPGMSFENIGEGTEPQYRLEPDQEFELYPDQTGTLEYPINIQAFSSTYNLTVYFPKNFGNFFPTRIYYIGLRGEFSEVRRKEVTICNYELAANLAKLKTTSTNTVLKQIC